MKIIRCLLLTALSCLWLHANAQSTVDSRDSNLRALGRRLQKASSIYIGMPFGEFSAYTPDGKLITNKALIGKVTLVLFWHPSISYSNRKYDAHYLDLKSLPDVGGKYHDFQIISIMADTAALALFRMQNPDANVYTIANLQSYAKASELNVGGGMPSCMLVDRYGRIARTSSMGRMLDEEGLADKIRELEMQ